VSFWAFFGIFWVSLGLSGVGLSEAGLFARFWRHFSPKKISFWRKKSAKMARPKMAEKIRVISDLLTNHDFWLSPFRHFFCRNFYTLFNFCLNFQFLSKFSIFFPPRLSSKIEEKGAKKDQKGRKMPKTDQNRPKKPKKDPRKAQATPTILTTLANLPILAVLAAPATRPIPANLKIVAIPALATAWQ
jgi:hypothetical protein